MLNDRGYCLQGPGVCHSGRVVQRSRVASQIRALMHDAFGVEREPAGTCFQGVLRFAHGTSKALTASLHTGPLPGLQLGHHDPSYDCNLMASPWDVTPP